MNNLPRLIVTLCLGVASLTSTAAFQIQAQNTTAQTISKPKKETLTNSSVIELAQLGLGEAVISEKIRQSDSNFDTSITGLKQLKAAKISDSIIALMINPNARANAQPAAAASKPAPATSAFMDSAGNVIPPPPDKGAYLWDGKKLSLLTQSQVPSMGVNVGRAIGSTLNPFMKNKVELQLIGTNAKASFDHTQPIILVSGMGDVIPGVPSYRLLYVKQGGMRKDRRILGTYDIGGFGSVAMVENEIPCEIKKVSEGIYAIKPQQPLKDGEYGLVPITRLADVQANSKSIAVPPVWDFGVYAEGKPKN